MKFSIQGLFPIPIYTASLKRNITKDEMNLINKSKKDVYKNTGNVTSNNNYILEKKQFKKLKNDLLLHVNNFCKNILQYKNVTPYITQSWINYTEKNEYHHSHAHPNSLISGVYYIDADEKNDKINFFDNKHQTIRPEIKTWNEWNSTSWWLPVKNNDIILFPSSLVHMVETKKGDNTRTSLAFNIFVKGILGNNKALTELKI